MNLVTCPGCGAEVPENARKCIVCGYKFPDLKGEFAKSKPVGSLTDGFWSGLIIESLIGLASTLFAKYLNGPSFIFGCFFGIGILLVGPLFLSGGGSKKVIGYLGGGVIGFVVGFYVFPILAADSSISILDYWIRKTKG